jgi:hypothetical protein
MRAGGEAGMTGVFASEKLGLRPSWDQMALQTAAQNQNIVQFRKACGRHWRGRNP